MFRRNRFTRARDCDHARRITVRNSGIERRVCERCGHVSFRAEEELSGTTDRSRFEREVERTAQSV